MRSDRVHTPWVTGGSRSHLESGVSELGELGTSRHGRILPGDSALDVAPGQPSGPGLRVLLVENWLVERQPVT